MYVLYIVYHTLKWLYVYVLYIVYHTDMKYYDPKEWHGDNFILKYRFHFENSKHFEKYLVIKRFNKVAISFHEKIRENDAQALSCKLLDCIKQTDV